MNASIIAITASLVYAPCVAFVCANAMKKITKDQENIGTIQTKMFIQTSLVELIPLLLIIFSFIQLDKDLANGLDVSRSVLSYFAVLGLIVIGSLTYLFMTYKKLKNNESPYLNTLLPISIALAVAVPMVSFVVLIIQSSQMT